MKYEEIHGDIFHEDMSCKFVQNISADFSMDKGIAVMYNECFSAKNMMYAIYPNTYVPQWNTQLPAKQGTCVYAPPVFNLITKKRNYDKPTLQAMENALTEMRALCEYYRIEKLAMPQIGCGMDRLQWEDVRQLIKRIFDDMDIEIHVWIRNDQKWKMLHPVARGMADA